MILKEVHKDISRYLEEDCYCPNEVYSPDGFFFVIIYDNAECKLIDTFERNGDTIYFVATYDSRNNPYLVNIWVNNDRVMNMERYEMSKQNIREITAFFKDKTEYVNLSEADKTMKELKEIMSMSDAVMIS